jgi:hypothetical protein
MQTAKIQVIVWFFITIATLTMYHFISVEKTPDEVKQATKEITLAKLAIKKDNIRRDDSLIFYGEISVLSVTLLCALMISRAYQKKLSIHILELRGAKIPLREKDLSKALPVAYDLALAEKMEQQFPEKAFALYEKLTDVRLRELQALTASGRANVQTALPLCENNESPCPGRVRSFYELLQSGEIAKGKPMILAEHEGELLRGSWLDLFSCAVGGQSGSGKTGTLRSYVCQSVLQGFGVWIIDPHYPHNESLQASLLPFIERGFVRVGLPVEICEEVTRTIDRRLQKKESSEIPAILVIDEVLDIMTNCPGAAQTIEKIGTQGRKCKVYGLFAGHSWLAAKTGGNSSLRDNLTAKIVHHMEKKQAKVLIDDSETTKQVQKLKVGEAFLKVIGKEPMAVKIHECVPSDVFRVAEILKVANGENRSSENNLQVDIVAKKQIQHVEMTNVSDCVSESETQSDTTCLNGETQPETQATHSDTWLFDFMEKHELSKVEVADILSVSVSLVKEILRGTRKLTSDRKKQIEEYFTGQKNSSNVLAFKKLS